MVIRTPASFTAGRRVKILGATYQPGDAVPNGVVKQLARLSALLSRRILVPNITVHPGRQQSTTVPSPSDLNPAQRRGL
jgi:hypothetical protein